MKKEEKNNRDRRSCRVAIRISLKPIPVFIYASMYGRQTGRAVWRITFSPPSVYCVLLSEALEMTCTGVEEQKKSYCKFIAHKYMCLLLVHNFFFFLNWLCIVYTWRAKQKKRKKSKNSRYIFNSDGGEWIVIVVNQAITICHFILLLVAIYEDSRVYENLK